MNPPCRSTLVRHVLLAYRQERAPIVASIERIDSTNTHLIRSDLAGRDIATLTSSDIARYRVAREAAGVKPQTVRRELTTLQAAARFAHAEGLIDRVPRIVLPPRGNPVERVLDRFEILALLAACREVGSRCELFLRLLLATGARISAVIELEWSSVDLVRKVIDLRSRCPRAYRRKNRAVVPICDATAEYLAAYRTRPADPPRRGRPSTQPPERLIGLSASCARRQLRQAADLAGIRGVTPHTIRHTVATQLMLAVPLAVASRMLGHKSVAITSDEYGHLMTRDLEPAAHVLDGLMPPCGALAEGKLPNAEGCWRRWGRRMMGWLRLGTAVQRPSAAMAPTP